MDQTSETEKALQKQKFDEIVEILLSAGYFRARISNLSSFDKVVGGLCWCITSSGEDVDVDILFQENSTIGQRIALSEAIVKALRKMSCPSPLQPHQIQGGVGGSDFPAIYPVIVWLVKKFFERREAREAELRSYSILQFSKSYQIPAEAKTSSSSSSSSTTTTAAASDVISADLRRVLSANKPVRAFKRKAGKGETEETRVQSCLLEFGESFFGAASKGGGKGAAGAGAKGADGSTGLESSMIRIDLSDSAEISMAALGKGGKGGASELSGFEKKLAQAAKEAQREEQAFAEQASRLEAELLSQMSQVSREDGVAGTQLGAIVGLHSDELSRAAAEYAAEMEETQRRMESSLAAGQLGQAAAHKRQRQHLLKQLEELDSKYVDLKASFDVVSEKLSIAEEDRAGSLEYIDQLNEQIAKIGQLEAASKQQTELATLKKLIALNETLKRQEAEFKASCKAQMQDFKAKIAALQSAEGDDSEENQKLADIEDMYAKVMAKYDKLRQLLAETNLEVANSVRIIDDVPTRTELIQYERRFVELYQQVNYKLEETRKYYDIYNTLDTTLSFIQKEVKILNSIHENFNEAMKSPGAKAEYLRQFESIIKNVDDSHKKQLGILGSKNQQVEELKVRSQELVDEQRRYFKAVKDFQEECGKNEWLVQKLEQLQGN